MFTSNNIWFCMNAVIGLRRWPGNEFETPTITEKFQMLQMWNKTDSWFVLTVFDVWWYFAINNWMICSHLQLLIDSLIVFPFIRNPIEWDRWLSCVQMPAQFLSLGSFWSLFSLSRSWFCLWERYSDACAELLLEMAWSIYEGALWELC